MIERKNLTSLIIVAILAVGLIVGLWLIQRSQIFKPKAAVTQVEFFGDNIVDLAGNKKGFTLDSKGEAKVNIRVTSPFGPASTGVGPGGPAGNSGVGATGGTQ